MPTKGFLQALGGAAPQLALLEPASRSRLMCRLWKSIAFLLGGLVMTGAAAAADPSIEDRWLTEKKTAIVEIFRCAGGDTLCGRVVWFRINPDEPNPQGLDLKNSDPALRTRPVCGLTVLYGFKARAEPNRWEGGMIYDPESGNTYHATMNFEADGTLHLRGYIGISLIGASEVWTRYSQPVPSCPTR
jgi:uncharacterized protein (DUF2147 family)